MSMVKLKKPPLNQHKVDITRWLYLNEIPFNVLTSPEFFAVYKKRYNKYTSLIKITFNNNTSHDHQRFAIDCAETLTHSI